MFEYQFPKEEIVETIKFLIYKEAPILFKKLDFNNDRVFLEPFLFIYFNNKVQYSYSIEVLQEVMQGYYVTKESLSIKHSLNSKNMAYIPKLGYYNSLNQKLEDCYIIDNTQIEVIYECSKLLEGIFEKATNQIGRSNIIMNKSLFTNNIFKIERALSLIKFNTPSFYQLIDEFCQKIVLFKTEPENTNSFATINAHGIIFLNLYLDDYSTVFFLDDISHQIGHVILTTCFFKKENIFKIPADIDISSVLDITDYRDFETLIHALYTYYTTLTCLNDYLMDSTLDEIEKLEAIGRIGFYSKKYQHDVMYLKAIADKYNGINNILHKKGVDLMKLIVENCNNVCSVWEKQFQQYKYNNQPYNFTPNLFFKENNICI